MLDTLFLLLLGGDLIVGLIWLKRKLEEREAKLSSGEEIGRLQQYTDGRFRGHALICDYSKPINH